MVWLECWVQDRKSSTITYVIRKNLILWYKFRGKIQKNDLVKIIYSLARLCVRLIEPPRHGDTKVHKGFSLRPLLPLPLYVKISHVLHAPLPG
ncbi:MAG: hypothetical protein BGP14_05980 [Sphingobacteriales bacterium 44-15]|nr:MAG: hypothetical protein BGP14_05980 [Sphingobacteriales bacterium 44-15]